MDYVDQGQGHTGVAEFKLEVAPQVRYDLVVVEQCVVHVHQKYDVLQGRHDAGAPTRPTDWCGIAIRILSARLASLRNVKCSAGSSTKRQRELRAIPSRRRREIRSKFGCAFPRREHAAYFLFLASHLSNSAISFFCATMICLAMAFISDDLP